MKSIRESKGVWVLWAIATVVTLLFTPLGYLASHWAYHQYVVNKVPLPALTGLALGLADSLWLVALLIAVGSAGLVAWKGKDVGLLAVNGQVLLFLGVCVLIAIGLWLPMELLCAHGL